MGEVRKARDTRGDRTVAIKVLPAELNPDVAAQSAEALDAAREHGIVHRGLKPGNVMVTTGGAGRVAHLFRTS